MTKARAFVKDRPVSQRLGAVGAVAVLATVPFGGLRPVAPPPQATFTIDKPFETAAFEVTVTRAVAVEDLAPAIYASEGKHLVALVMEVVNTTDRPERSITLKNAIRVRGAGVEAAAYSEDGSPQGTSGTGQVIQISDGTPINVFNPDVTYQAAMVWEAADTGHTETGETETGATETGATEIGASEIEVQVRHSWWSLSEGTHAFQPYWLIEPDNLDFVTRLPIVDKR